MPSPLNPQHCPFMLMVIINTKSLFSWFPEIANYFGFLQKFGLRARKICNRQKVESANVFAFWIYDGDKEHDEKDDDGSDDEYDEKGQR